MHNIFLSFIIEVQNVSEELLSKAMAEGVVECKSIILLLIGVAGSGKSSFKRVLFNEDLDVVRDSTPLAEPAVRAVSTVMATASQTEWVQYSLPEILVNFSLNRTPKKNADEINVNRSPISPLPHSRDREISSDSDPVPSSNLSDRNDESLSADGVEEVILQQPVPVQIDNTETEQLLLHSKLRTNETVRDICKRICQKSVTTLIDFQGRTWIYVIDSGGQPQFQELLPLFIKSASAVAFFVKVNERLDDFPKVQYFSRNKEQGESYEYSLTHRQVLQSSFHTIQSRQDASGDQEYAQLFFIGTFRDKVSNCDENIESKNASIRSMIENYECLRENVRLYQGNDLLFPINAQKPDENDHDVANLFKRRVTEQSENSKSFGVPVKWFLFEQIIQEMSKVNNRQVFSMAECTEIASWLHIDTDNLHVALEYLTRHNILTWFRSFLPDVVFTSSQVILDKLSEVVKLSYVLCNNINPENTYTRDFLRGISYGVYDFKHYGYVTVKILKQFEKHYTTNFTPSDLLTIWVKLLVVALDSRGRYFMPCILRSLSEKELCPYRLQKEDAPSPLVICCHDKLIFPPGIFSCLISYLCNISQWNVLKSGNYPKCFFKNCVQLRCNRIKITLIYCHNFIEVYPVWLGSKKSLPKLIKDCELIGTTILQGLLEAAKLQNYVHFSPKYGVLCPYKHKDLFPPHAALMYEDNDMHYHCTEDEDVCEKLVGKQLFWYPCMSVV